jgi:hypothetical protein
MTTPASGKTPNTRTLEATVPAQGTAGTPQDQAVGEAPFDGSVTSVKIVPEANLTANASNFRTFRLLNKGQDGNGSTVVATFATDTPTADDLADFDERVIPLSVVAGAANVVAGDVLAVDETVTGTGVAHSGYRVIVEISRG